MALDAESGNGDPEFPHDWRGRDIGARTRVVWRSGAINNATWHIGRVERVSRVKPVNRWDDGWRLRINWEDLDGSLTDRFASNIRISNVMVLREAAN
jgi:hypothetical protein